jgi:hypothetical protein
MHDPDPIRVAEESLGGHPLAVAALHHVHRLLAALGDVEVRTTTSQVAFRRRRGCAYLWLPGRYLSNPSAEVVLSIVLGHHDPSPRFTEVVHPSPAHWMHHLELHTVADLDDEVAGWLRAAWEHAA